MGAARLGTDGHCKVMGVGAIARPTFTAGLPALKYGQAGVVRDPTAPEPVVMNPNLPEQVVSLGGVGLLSHKVIGGVAAPTRRCVHATCLALRSAGTQPRGKRPVPHIGMNLQQLLYKLMAEAKFALVVVSF